MKKKPRAPKKPAAPSKTATLSQRVSVELIRRVDAAVQKATPKYRSRNHFIEVALERLVFHEEGENL